MDDNAQYDQQPKLRLVQRRAFLGHSRYIPNSWARAGTPPVCMAKWHIDKSAPELSRASQLPYLLYPA
jgi:hypothetical protein